MQIPPMHTTDSMVLLYMRHASMPHWKPHHRLFFATPCTHQPISYIVFVSFCVIFVFFCAIYVLFCVIFVSFCFFLCLCVLCCDVMYVPSVLVTRVCLIKLLSLGSSFLQWVSGVSTPPITPPHTCECAFAWPLAFISSNSFYWGIQLVL